MERRFSSLDSFLLGPGRALGTGPIALIFAEDASEVDTTLRHHLDRGFAEVVAFMDPGIPLPRDVQLDVWQVDYDMRAEGALTHAVNAMIEAAPGRWMYYCYNAEYLFYPFCETRSVGELLAFHTEERRDAMLSYVVDLYSDDLARAPNAVSLPRAHLDRTGYYALERPGHEGMHGPMERQLNFFGGLRWRFEEHIPAARRKIDRISLFRAKPGLTLRDDHTFSDEEYNTYACPWHNNLTAAIVSFRTAKALKTNPGSRDKIPSFLWHNSAPFEWHSRQLLDLGLMEPGQWF